MRDKLLVDWDKPIVLKRESNRFLPKYKGGPAKYLERHPDGWKVQGNSGSIYLFDSFGSFIDLLHVVGGGGDTGLCCVNAFTENEEPIEARKLPPVEGIDGQGIF